jgi:hypothetical protein
MARRHRWVPLITKLFLGIALGGMIALLIACTLESVLSLFGIDDARPYDNMTAPFLVPLPFLFGAYWLMKELRRQRSGYWKETNRCASCGYSLSGIRQTSDRCPECGKAFKGGKVT